MGAEEPTNRCPGQCSVALLVFGDGTQRFANERVLRRIAGRLALGGLDGFVHAGLANRVHQQRPRVARVGQ